MATCLQSLEGISSSLGEEMSNNHLVTVFGPTGSGKDTFIRELQLHLTAADIANDHVSSIDPIRAFYRVTLRKLDDQHVDEPLTSAKDRQALADIKKALDTSLDWTVRYALQQLSRWNNTVVCYQVREITNIVRLQLHCKLHQISFTAVYVHRPGIEQAPGATTDVYRWEDVKCADLVVVNTTIESLHDYAGLLVSRIKRDFKHAE